MAAEGQDSLAIVGDSKRAMAGYLLMMVSASTGATTPRRLLTYAFGTMGIHIGTIIAAQDAPSQQGPDGSVQGQEIMEFSGTYQGQAVHGRASIYCNAGPSVVSGVLRLGMAATSRWNAVNSGVIHLMTSIQHNFTQDQAQIDRLNHQQQHQHQQQQHFDNVINGVQGVQDPSTGTVYEAPYDS